MSRTVAVEVTGGRRSARMAWRLGLLLAAMHVFGPLALAKGFDAERDRIVQRLEAQYRGNPDDIRVVHQLAQALLLRARESANPRDIEQAEALIRRSMTLAPQAPQTWTLKAWSEMGRHRFGEALASARRGYELDPRSAANLGIMSDALVELGRYQEAVKATQAMMDLAPGLPAYTRAAHLRFLHGDTEGAIELMQSAVMAGKPRSEETAWALLQLSELYLQRGDALAADKAAHAAAETLAAPAALAQMGRVRVLEGRFAEALVLFKQAQKKQTHPEYAFAIWELARGLGMEAEEKRQAALLKALAQLDETSGGLNRRLFAAFLAQQPDGLMEAERLARLDLVERPDIYSEENLAWTLHRAGKTEEAARHAENALRLGTQDSMILYRCGAILAQAGQVERGRALARLALQRNPYVDFGHASPGLADAAAPRPRSPVSSRSAGAGDASP